MTILNIIEEIKQFYPEAGDTQILIELNKAYKTFCYRTKILKAEVIIGNDDAGWTLFNEEATIDLYGKYIQAVNEVIFRDTSGVILDVNPCEFTIVGNSLILKYASLLTDLTTQGGFGDIQLKGVRMPYKAVAKLPSDDEIDETDEEIDEDLVDGIVAKSMEKFALMKRDFDMVKLNREKWNLALLEGMRQGAEGSNGLQINVLYK